MAAGLVKVVVHGQVLRIVVCELRQCASGFNWHCILVYTFVLVDDVSHYVREANGSPAPLADLDVVHTTEGEVRACLRCDPGPLAHDVGSVERVQGSSLVAIPHIVAGRPTPCVVFAIMVHPRRLQAWPVLACEQKGWAWHTCMDILYVVVLMHRNVNR